MAKRSTNSQVGVTWQEVTLPISQGVDLRANDRSRPMAKLARLVNGAFGERNSVVKRNGYRGSDVVIEGNVQPDTEFASDEEWVYGYGRHSPTQNAGFQPGQGQVLGVVTRENQLGAWTGDRLLTYDSAQGTWTGEHTFWDQTNTSPEALPRGVPLFAPHGPVEDVPQRAEQAGIYHCWTRGDTHRLHAWVATETGSGLNRLWIRVEGLDGAVVRDDYKVLSGTDRNGSPYDLSSEDVGNLRALWLNGYLCVVAELLTSDDIALIRVIENDPLGTVLADALASAAVNSAKCWDTAKVSDSLGVLAYRDNTSIKLTYFRGDSGPVGTPAPVGTVLDLDSNLADGSLGVAVAPNGNVGLCWDSTGASPCYTGVYSSDGVLQGSVGAVNTSTDPGQRITVAAMAVANDFAAYVEVDGAVVVQRFDEAGTDSTQLETRHNCAIAGQSFGVGNIPFVTLTTLDLGPVKQATYILQGGILRPRLAGAWSRGTAYSVPRGASGGAPVIVPGSAQDLPRGVDFLAGQSPLSRTRWLLSFSHQPRYLKGDTVFMFTGAVTGVEGLEDGIVGRGQRDVTLTETRGLRVEMDFTRQLTWEAYGRSTYFSGAQPHVWDGDAVTEAGFLQWPEHTSNPVVANDAGAAWDTQDGLFPGLYRYRVYFCRRNRFGEVSRSPAISFPLQGSSAVSVPDATSKVTLTLSTLEATEDENVYYEVYRTLAGGTVYHLVSGWDVSLAKKNNRNSATVTIVDTVPDSLAEDFPTDPHNPNPGFPVELEEVALPGCETLAQANDRLWFAGGLVPSGRLFYSKAQEPGEQAAWNDLGVLEYTLDNSTKPVTGVGDLNGQPIIFRAAGVYSVEGEGPDNLGSGTYSVARRVSTDLGAVNQHGIIRTSDGLAFYSGVGPRVVTETGSIAILGDEVAPAAVGRVPVGSVVAPKSSQVRWFLDNGTVLAYDYVVRFWAIHTGLDAVATCAYADGATLARSDAKVLLEDVSVYSDAGRPYEFLMRTSELRPEDLMQGSSRVRRWAISGLWRGSHSLRTRVRFDGSETVAEDVVWDPDGDVGNEVWGTSDIWPGSQSSRDGVYRTRRRLRPRRLASISFEFSDGCADGNSFVITELALELGQKDGLSRLPRRSFT